MKELTIHHDPAEEGRPARVRVRYRSREGAQAQERETDFSFSIAPEERRLIQWYLEKYLLLPWGEFRNRAKTAEEWMERRGAKLFDRIAKRTESDPALQKALDLIGK